MSASQNFGVNVLTAVYDLDQLGRRKGLNESLEGSSILSNLHFNTPAAELLVSKIRSDRYPARDGALKSLGSIAENNSPEGRQAKMTFQSFLPTAKILPAAGTALSRTEEGHRLHKITTDHLALPSMPVLLHRQEGKAFGKPYSAALAQQLSYSKHQEFL